MVAGNAELYLCCDPRLTVLCLMEFRSKLAQRQPQLELTAHDPNPPAGGLAYSDDAVSLDIHPSQLVSSLSLSLSY